MNCAHSPTAITIATPARTAVAVSTELVSGASRTASRPVAKSALVAARAWVRRIRLTTRVAGICARTMKKVLMKTTTPISPGPTAVCAFANGARMLLKSAPPVITNTMLAAIRMRKSRSRATARKPVPLSLARRSVRKARIRNPREHHQREHSEGEAVEEVERLKRAQVIGGSDDEARNRRAAAETEVACDPAERDRGGALLRRDQGQAQNLVRGVRDSEPGAADGRAEEGLPGTAGECEARVTKCVREIAGDQDRLRAETIEQRTRKGRDDRRRAHDRRQHQPRNRRRETAGLVQIDDLEGKDQPGAEIVDRGPSLKNFDRPRQARPPAAEHTSERPAHLLPAAGCFPVPA